MPKDDDLWIDVDAIVEGYRQGYFLIAEEDGAELSWYTSRERTLIPLDDRFHTPRSLRRVLNQNRFRTAINEDFDAVVEGCASRETTWISEELKRVYRTLYKAGWAHSFETWQGQELAGGILGLSIDGMFIGESMFYAIPEGSKVAMVKLVEYLQSRGFVMFDAQLMNPHLERFGAYVISARDYQKRLSQATRQSCSFI
jgi:leucyl/phenylalanyl-tRNA---protein transferase